MICNLNSNLIRQNECRLPGYIMKKVNNQDQGVGNEYVFRVPNKWRHLCFMRIGFFRRLLTVWEEGGDGFWVVAVPQSKAGRWGTSAPCLALPSSMCRSVPRQLISVELIQTRTHNVSQDQHVSVLIVIVQNITVLSQYNGVNRGSVMVTQNCTYFIMLGEIKRELFRYEHDGK